MGYKAFFFLVLLWTLLLFISSDVAARDLAETSSHKKHGEAGSKTNEYVPEPPDLYGDPLYSSEDERCYYGCCSAGAYGGCDRCCFYAGETAEEETEANPHN